MVVSVLAGYWPDWHTNLYWYLLVGGILFVTTVDAKNPYCSWLCPFGAFQECMAAVSKAKVFRPRLERPPQVAAARAGADGHRDWSRAARSRRGEL